MKLSTRHVFSAIGAAAILAGASAAMAGPFDGKKVLHIESYNPGYAWSDEIVAGVRKVIEPSGAELKTVHMDTKNNPSPEYAAAKGVEMKALIGSWKPDVVIATDDNASKYVIVPHFKNAALPFVFAGVNWDATVYGFPFSNVTGMVEVSATDELVATLRKTGAGEKIALLSTDESSERKETENLKSKLGMTFVEERYVNSFDEWRKAYLELQEKAGVIVIGNNASMPGWDDKAAAAFVEANAKAFTGSTNVWMAPFVMLAYAKVGAEQGRWAAETALAILGGTKPADIPLTRNKEGRIAINARIAQKLNANIPTDLLESAETVIE